MVMDQQQHIVRDFLGLGKLVIDDQGLEGDASSKPSFLSYQGSIPPSSSMDFRGVKHPVCNIDRSMECNFDFKKASEGIYAEGSAKSYGMASGRQWQGMVPGMSTAMGEPPARLLAPAALAKSNGMQLTIFYGGQVNVYNDVNADKAQEIMHMAGNGSLLSSDRLILPLGAPHFSGAQGFCQPAGPPENFCFEAQAGPVQFVADQVSLNCPAANKQFEGAMPNTPSSASSSQPAVPKALPLARKASLARFLEKRKERMQMMMPYFKKQLSSAQVLSTGDQMVAPFHGATLAKLYEEYYRRPSSMVFAMPEHMAPHNRMPSRSTPAKE